MANKVTIQDIARKAGVGAGTVSRVLNHHPSVSDNVRERVAATIAELKYRPSFAARHMRTQRSQVFAFVTDEVATTPYAVKTVEGAQEIAWENDRLLFIVNTKSDPRMEEAAIEHLLERQVEGIIYAAMYHREADPPALLKQVPTVLLDCFTRDGRYTSVVPDEVRAARTATEHLIAHGHRRIALLNLRAASTAGRQRLDGYRQALEQHNIPLDETLIRYGNWAADEGYRLTQEVMQLVNPPTAIFCANDRTAMGAYDALKELGLRIPQDVAVMGFDNQEVISAYLRPALSTMTLPHYEMGRWAMQYLLDLDNEIETSPFQHRLECRLVSRESI